jgi:hypothetical protein
MNTSESFRALRRANPRAQEGFARSVEAAAAAVHAQIDVIHVERSRGRRLVGRSAAAALAAVAVAATLLAVGSPNGVEDATAALESAAAVTAASAERSGIAVVRITRDGELWAGTTLRWNGEDIALSSDTPGRNGRAGSELRIVDGTVYGIDERDGGWVAMGSPANIDPDSGTTPTEHLAAVREDVGGTTLRRLAGGMTGLTTRRAGGSTVYSGTVAAGLIARESGVKEGRSIRVFPFGLVAHDEAADPAAPLDTAVTVGADDVVRQVAVTWGTWSYTVSYRGLGKTPAPAAPANARSLLEERLRRTGKKQPGR